jgi:hypothetical protein
LLGHFYFEELGHFNFGATYTNQQAAIESELNMASKKELAFVDCVVEAGS